MSNPKKDDKGFTSNEVATLLEDIKSQFRAVTEGVTSLDDRMGRMEEDLQVLKEDMTVVKSDLTTVKDAVSIAIPGLNKRVTTLEAKSR